MRRLTVNASSRKAIRTAVQVTVGAIVCLAALVPFLGLNTGKYAAVGLGIIAVATAVTKAQTAAEAAGKLPILLNPAAAAPTAPAVAPAPPA